MARMLPSLDLISSGASNEALAARRSANAPAIASNAAGSPSVRTPKPSAICANSRQATFAWSDKRVGGSISERFGLGSAGFARSLRKVPESSFIAVGLCSLAILHQYFALADQIHYGMQKVAI